MQGHAAFLESERRRILRLYEEGKGHEIYHSFPENQYCDFSDLLPVQKWLVNKGNLHKIIQNG